MELSKGATKGIGALTLVAVLAAAGFLVIKPQIDEAIELQSQTAEMRDMTDVREIRLSKLEAEKSNLDALSLEVNDLLLRITSDKKVTDIAGAVVAALPPGVNLESFSHGPLDPAQPNFKTPLVALEAIEAPFTLEKVEAQTSAPAEAAEGEDVVEAPVVEPEVAVEVTPAFAGAPFIITVRASSFESLTNFMDVMQYQKRLITVVAVTSGAGDGGIRATIYAYAFASSTPKIVEWETPSS